MAAIKMTIAATATFFLKDAAFVETHSSALEDRRLKDSKCSRELADHALGV